MGHQKWPLSKENTIERKHKSAQFSSFPLPNPWLQKAEKLDLYAYFIQKRVYIKDILKTLALCAF